MHSKRQEEIRYHRFRRLSCDVEERTGEKESERRAKGGEWKGNEF
jgi:hypothetical protein